MKGERRELPLEVKKSPLFVIDDALKEQREELDEFISDLRYMNTLKFSKDVLFSHEIQANNFIEGYRDDVETIYDVIHKCSKITDPEKKQRIMNLYKGYKYILSRKDLNPDTLRYLYNILSRDLLSQEDRNNMGKYYRNNPVYIYYSNRIDISPDEGIPSSEIEEHMKMLLGYANSDNSNLSKAELFLKSQIIHFYFVYIHPYYDINGRTSRTTSMWFLLNNKSYPFIIFNRAIQLCKEEYYKVIRETKGFRNATYFLKYMMEHTIIELEKDYVMNMIKNSTNYKLTSVDYQTLHYILSINGAWTYLDFASFYNRQNEHRKVHEIFTDMLLPLLDAGILIEGRKTKKQISGKIYNHTFSLNSNLYEVNPNKIKRIILK